MLICIIGKSGSGKDTVARLLQKWYQFKPVCSYTSRAKRSKETEGVEHYFITKEEALNILDTKADQVVAKTEIDGNIYFALKEDLEKADIYVIDPAGIEYLQEHFPEIELFQLYVHCDDAIARERAEQRGDNMEIYESRHKSENEMFENYYQQGKYDKVIDNGQEYTLLESNLRHIIWDLLNKE